MAQTLNKCRLGILGPAVSRDSSQCVSHSSLIVQLIVTSNTVMDNHRVLHGRSAFTGKRRMCGAYIGVDEYRSKLAVLKERFGGRDPTAIEPGTVEVAKERNIWSAWL